MWPVKHKVMEYSHNSTFGLRSVCVCAFMPGHSVKKLSITWENIELLNILTFSSIDIATYRIPCIDTRTLFLLIIWVNDVSLCKRTQHVNLK